MVRGVVSESLDVAANVVAIALSVERVRTMRARSLFLEGAPGVGWIRGRVHAKRRSWASCARSDGADLVAGPPAAEGCARRARPPALVVIDMQNGFVNERTRSALPWASKLIEHWQARLWPVVFTRFHNPEGSGYERWLAWTGLRDDDETALHDVVARYADTIVDKTSYTAFTSEGERRWPCTPATRLSSAASTRRAASSRLRATRSSARSGR